MQTFLNLKTELTEILINRHIGDQLDGLKIKTSRYHLESIDVVYASTLHAWTRERTRDLARDQYQTKQASKHDYALIPLVKLVLPLPAFLPLPAYSALSLSISDLVARVRQSSLLNQLAPLPQLSFLCQGLILALDRNLHLFSINPRPVVLLEAAQLLLFQSPLAT